MFANSKKQRQKQFRKKVAGDDEDEQNNNAVSVTNGADTNITEPETKDDTDFEIKLKQREEKKAVSAKKREDNKKQTTTKTLLSFADEEEADQSSANIRITTNFAEVVQKKKEKKKSSSRPLLRNMASTADVPVLDSKPTSAGWTQQVEYSSEKLEEMKKNSMNYVPPTSEELKLSEDIDMEVEPTEEPTLSDGHPSTTHILNANQVEALEEKEEEEDEDFKRWELEQIKKGGGGQFRTNEIGNTKTTQAIATLQSKQKEPTPKKIPLLSPLTPSSRISVEEMQKRLKQSFASLSESHELHKKQLEETTSKLNAAKAEIDSLDKRQKGISDQYVFYQQMKDYVADLCDCLAEKAPVIEECEEQILKLDVQRVEKLEYRGELIWSENDTSMSEPWYAEPKEVIIKKAEALFSDTDDDFASISAIKEKFENWRFRQHQSYRDAYCAFSLPTLFAPFVRLQLLRWDPFTTPAFDTMPWYTELFNYGIDPSGNSMDSNEEDLNLVPQIIEKVICPKLTTAITNVWNPRLDYQNKNVLELVKQMLIYLDPKSNAIKDLLSSVVVAVQGVVDKLPTLRDESSKHEVDLYLKFLHNVSQWNGYLAPETMRRIVVDTMVNMKLLSLVNRVRTKDYSLEVIERMLQVLPSDWVRKGKQGNLALLHNTVMNLAKKFEAEKNADALLRIQRLLVDLNDKEGSQMIASKR